MCYNRIYSEVKADGTKETWSEPEICPDKCLHFSQLHYPTTKHRERSSSRGPYGRVQFPPTPPLSYHSDYTSDSERSSRRRSGVYVTDHKVLEINGKRHSRHERQHSSERGSYLGSSPLSRTPPLYHRSRPSSPAVDLYEPEYRSRPSSSHSRSSHSGPHVTVEIINGESKSHRRHGSSSKTSSRDSNDEERRRRVSLQHGDQLRLSKKESEILRQNKAIKDRVPIPQGPSHSSGYRRGSVSVTPTLPMTERLRIEEEKAERRRQKALKEEKKREEEAQQQRLKDRFTAKRSNTVSYSGRQEYYY